MGLPQKTIAATADSFISGQLPEAGESKASFPGGCRSTRLDNANVKEEDCARLAVQTVSPMGVIKMEGHCITKGSSCMALKKYA